MSTLFASIALLSILLPAFGRLMSRRVGGMRRWTNHRIWAPMTVSCVLASLVHLGWSTGELPIATVSGGLQAVALLISVAWLGLRRHERMEAAGSILLALAAVLLAVSLVEPSGAATPGVESFFVALHLALIFLGLGGYAVSFALSALFLIQRRRLKRKMLDGIQDLPSLETLDQFNVRTQSFGFVALTAGVAMGVMLALEGEPTRALTGPTVWGTGAVWIWYLVGLQTRLIGGWRGRTAAVFGVVGFGAIGLMIGLTVVVSGGWHAA